MTYNCPECGAPQTGSGYHHKGCSQGPQVILDASWDKPPDRKERRATERRDAKTMRKENEALRLEIAGLRQLERGLT